MCQKISDYTNKREELLEKLKKSNPETVQYWQAYCAFIDAEAALDAAIARVDKANGEWGLRVVK